MPTDPEDVDRPRGHGQSTRRRGPRRTVLRAAGASLLAAGLAGCFQTRQRRYEAAPASLAPEAGDLGFEADVADWSEVKRTEPLVGGTVEVTLRSYGATYDGFPIGLAVGATPTADEAGQQLNPVVTASSRELLTGEAGAPLREHVDLRIGADVEWTRGPGELTSTEGTLLGHGVEVKTFLGTTDEPEAVLIHLTRTVHRGDVVVVGSGRSWAIDPADDGPLTGEGEAFTRALIDDGLGPFLDALPLVVREEMSQLSVGTETETTRTESDDGE